MAALLPLFLLSWRNRLKKKEIFFYAETYCQSQLKQRIITSQLNSFKLPF